MAITCAAILCVHNEEAHLRRAISDFINQGIDVAIIDNGSTDGTAQICSDFLGKGLLLIEHMPWHGEYDQTAQLMAKNNLISRLHHDWVIHADADEYMHTRTEGESLLEGIRRISALGFNAINFDEFVFLPKAQAMQEARHCKQEFLDYYFFEPKKNRLMRAWNRQHHFSNVASGGHVLEGADLLLATESFVLRHYIVLSQSHAILKYSNRVFAACDLEKGWHGNRISLGVERLQLPDSSVLKHLPYWQSAALDSTEPKSKHFWDWPYSDRCAISE